jgi:glycosyltransferase involved in cell wall biosynthesis
MLNKIGINLLYINPKLAGGSVTYALKFLEELSKIDSETEYIVYINKDCENINFIIGRNFKLKILNFRYSSVYKRYIWEQFILPFYLFRDKISLIHSLGYVTPLLTFTPKIVSILDINYRGHSGNMSFHKRILLGLMVNLSAFFSRRIITISEFSKQQIIKFTGTRGNKILVTLLSGSNDNELGELHEIKTKYNINSEYLVAFSSPSPHKNISRLLEAFKIVSLKKPELKLVLIGHQNKNEALLETIQKNHLLEKVIFTGFVPDEDIFSLINSAKVFVFPSLYEGFGIPLLDAQKCRVPVVSSNAGSLPEVGGDSVLYFNPTDVLDISDKIFAVLDNDEMTKSLIADGIVNRKQFSWSKAASETFELYKEVLN